MLHRFVSRADLRSNAMARSRWMQRSAKDTCGRQLSEDPAIPRNLSPFHLCSSLQHPPGRAPGFASRLRAFGDGDADFGDAAGVVGFIAECDGAAVGFNDLTGESKADAGAGLFCGVERNEEVLRIGEARSGVFDPDLDEVAVAP